MKKSHVYTRGGDSGTTSLIGGNRVKKNSLRINAYGTIDELSSHPQDIESERDLMEIADKTLVM